MLFENMGTGMLVTTLGLLLFLGFVILKNVNANKKVKVKTETIPIKEEPLNKEDTVSHEVDVVESEDSDALFEEYVANEVEDAAPNDYVILNSSGGELKYESIHRQEYVETPKEVILSILLRDDLYPRYLTAKALLDKKYNPKVSEYITNDLLIRYMKPLFLAFHLILDEDKFKKYYRAKRYYDTVSERANKIFERQIDLLSDTDYLDIEYAKAINGEKYSVIEADVLETDEALSSENLRMKHLKLAVEVTDVPKNELSKETTLKKEAYRLIDVSMSDDELVEAYHRIRVDF